MPAQDLNKPTLINLLIDSPLREPIKINLIDIVNNTADADLPKVYPTITKELEIFQKATERRMKLADETIKKLGGEDSASSSPPPASSKDTVPAATPLPQADTGALTSTQTDSGLKVPPLDLPPLPTPVAKTNGVEPTPPVAKPLPPFPPLPSPDAPAEADEAALKEIQQELDALKSSAQEEAAPPPLSPQA